MPIVDNAAVLDLVRRKIKAAGSQRAFAERHGLNPQFLNATLTGRVELGATIAATVRAIPVPMWNVADDEPAPAPSVAVPADERADDPPEPVGVSEPPADAEPETCGACIHFQRPDWCGLRDMETTAAASCPLFEAAA